MLNLFVDSVLVNSNAIKEKCIHKESVKKEKVVLIYNGLSEKFLKAGEVEGDNYNSRPESEGFSVGNLSNLNPIKGINTFLNACPLILEKFSQTRFFLIGDGPMRADLEEQARNLSIRDKVTFTGNLNDVMDVFSKIDISVNSSLSEGFSNAILESMALKMPVVATNVGGNPEVVIDGQTGFIVPAGDHIALAGAVIKLLEDRALAQQMGAAGRERVINNFTMDKMIGGYERFYIEMIERKCR